MNTPSIILKSLKCGNNRGVAFVYIALLLFAMVAFVAIAIDIGYMYITKTQLQNAADSAALSGAARLNGTAFTNQTGARLEAQRFAAQNKAAAETINIDTNDSNINSISNSYDGDIILGYWDGNLCNPNIPSGQRVNCVKVKARRTNEILAGVSAQNKPVNTFFGKVLNISQINISASAIAVKTPAKVLPITINEYWRANSNNPAAPQLIPPGQQPYGTDQDYPNSFVRVNNVNGTASKVFGKTFALLGADASDNIPASIAPGAQNVNGYVNLNYRSSNHDGSGNSWYELTMGTFAPFVCSACTSLFAGPSLVKSGAVVNEKFDAYLQYLLEGFPENFPFPTAVKEVYTSTYPTTSYSISPTSNCPYATVAYFSEGGIPPINKQYNGKDFPEVYPTGSKLIVMVYDGTFKAETDPNAANAVTNVGYVPIQIDGYSSSNPKGLLNPNGVTTNLGISGNTAYGHALANIIEPSSTIGPCDISFFDSLYNLLFQFGSVKLVK